MKKISVLGITAFTTVLLTSCYYDNFKELNPESALSGSSNCDTIAAISYSAQILPIITEKCISCHGAGGSSPELSDHSTISSAINLLGSVRWDSGISPMPKSSTTKIPDCDIAKIRLWTAQGKPNN